MEPTVLAGAIEFSPAEIAFFLAVLAAAALIVTAPGWLVLGVVTGRRAGPSASAGRRWASGIGGALLGIALSAGVTATFGAVFERFSSAVPMGVLASWAACWVLAAVMRRPAVQPAVRPGERPVPPPAMPITSDRSQEGWGR